MIIKTGAVQKKTAKKTIKDKVSDNAKTDSLKKDLKKDGKKTAENKITEKKPVQEKPVQKEVQKNLVQKTKLKKTTKKTNLKTTTLKTNGAKTPLELYISKFAGSDNRKKKISTMMVSYVSQLQNISEVSPEISHSIVKELEDQRNNIKLIASENYCSSSVQAAMGNLFTDKYSEGFPFHRFYAGCDNVDSIEALACETACRLFGSDHAYVQPHSGADANLCAYWAILTARVQLPVLKKMKQFNLSKLSACQWKKIRKLTGNQKILALDYYSGGHLTHGYRQNISAHMFDAYSYSVNKQTGLLDYDEILRLAKKIKPLILLAGYSAYPRKINFKIMKEIASSCGAVLMVDMAHFAGLVAGKVFEGEYNPVLWADVVTTTTHKTLRGPRGGMILCKEEFAESVDKGCPLVLGGPLPHIIAAKAVALKEASTPSFELYAHKIVENAQALAQACIEDGMQVLTGGTDNHLMLLDVTSFGLNGRQAEKALRECGLTVNRNALPFDSNGPWYTSGLRLGTPAVTTLGMGVKQMRQIASLISTVLTHTKPEFSTEENSISKTKISIDANVKEEVQSNVKKLLSEFLLYPDLDLEFLKKNF